LSVLNFDGAIKAHVNVAVQVKELFKNVEHLSHLGEDNHLASLVVESFKQLCKFLKLTAVVLDKVLVGEEKDIRVFQGLVNILVLHQLLVQEALVRTFFLMASVYA